MLRKLPAVDESILRLVEHLACRLAERAQGRLTPYHLLPYVPLSLELIRTCLDDMLDGEAVESPAGEELTVYQFTAYRNLPMAPGILTLENCSTCGTPVGLNTASVLCSACAENLYRAGSSLAKTPGWVEQAQLEHALLYAAAPYAGKPIALATLASRAHRRMRAVRLCVDTMTREGYLQQEADPKTGALVYTFPPILYPRALYETNVQTLHAWARAGAPGFLGVRQRWLYALGLGLVLSGVAAWFLQPASPPARPLSPSAVLPERAGPAPRPPLPPAAVPPAPTYGKAYHEHAMSHAIPVPVSIRRDGFTPVVMKVAASWKTPTPLSPTPPGRIIKHPAYQGSSQRYGILHLGTRDNTRYDFVFDLITGPNPIVYFDANQNGDLTDDGPPLTNQGTGIFATTITLPFSRLIKEVTFSGAYALWFFTNDHLWQRNAVAHYSRTQLQGTVHIAGQAYVAYLADAGQNEADLTNDGISVDLNGDGTIDRHQEYFPPDKVAHLGGKDYVFIVTW